MAAPHNPSLQDPQGPISPPSLPTGPYFFYGTLMDPQLLTELLNLSHTPRLRPATLVGYSIKLWGPYPALVAGPANAVLQGMVYEVESKAHAARLAEYETSAYAPAVCSIHFVDGLEPRETSGFTFLYVGDSRQIKNGTFDLATWLRVKQDYD